MDNIWSDLHNDYKDRDWIDKPSLFAQTAIVYFPHTGKVLDLGAGLGQDSRYFAERGYQVVSTDIDIEGLKEKHRAYPQELANKVSPQMADLTQELPFGEDSFDVVYAHLSLHYFDYKTTSRIFSEIQRVLKPGGVLAFFVNSTSDPEYNTGTKLEGDYFQIGKMAKRYFSVDSARLFARYFDTNLIDNLGETYKDSGRGIHNLVRYIGHKPLERIYTMALPFCAAIIERQVNGQTELLLQTRWQPGHDTVYTGTLEFPAGALDEPFENIYDTLAREIKEECGLTLKTIRQDDRSEVLNSGRGDGIIGFRPFCCVQQLKNGKPWIGFIFVCEVEPGELTAEAGETKDPHWMGADEVRKMYETQPEKLFGLELPAWQYYFDKHD